MTYDDINARYAELPPETRAAFEEAQRAEERRNALTIGAVLNGIRPDRAVGTHTLLGVIELAKDLILGAIYHPTAVGDEFVMEAYGQIRGTCADFEELFFPADSGAEFP